MTESPEQTVEHLAEVLKPVIELMLDDLQAGRDQLRVVARDLDLDRLAAFPESRLTELIGHICDGRNSADASFVRLVGTELSRNDAIDSFGSIFVEVAREERARRAREHVARTRRRDRDTPGL